MQHTHFVVHQSIDLVFDGGHWQKVSRGIDHHSPPHEVGLIVDEDGSAFDEIFAIVSLFQKLRECFEPSEKPNVAVSNKFPVVSCSDSQLILFMFSLLCNHLVGISDGDDKLNVPFFGFLTLKHICKVQIDYLFGVVGRCGLHDKVDRAWIDLTFLTRLIHCESSRQWPYQ